MFTQYFITRQSLNPNIIIIHTIKNSNNARTSITLKLLPITFCLNLKIIIILSNIVMYQIKHENHGFTFNLAKIIEYFDQI